MRYLLILCLLLVVPVQALLAQPAEHCPSSATQAQHSVALHQQHAAVVAASEAHCSSQAPSTALKHCHCCVLCPALSALPTLSGRLASGFKAPQLAARAQAHSNQHVDVAEKPPKTSLLV